MKGELFSQKSLIIDIYQSLIIDIYQSPKHASVMYLQCHIVTVKVIIFSLAVCRVNVSFL